MTPSRSPRLRIVPAEQTTEAPGPVQDCSTCRTMPICWMAGIKEEHTIISLLVCRIKRNIDVDRSAKTLLHMLRPKLKTLARHAVRGTRIDTATAMADLESTTLEYLQHYYVMGEIAYPLHYLFGMPHGVMKHYADNYGRKTKRYEETHQLEAEPLNETATAFTSDDGTHGPSDLMRRTRAVIEDGTTLNLAEYHVIRFCLDNAVEARRPMNGLHVYLARQIGINRTKCTKIFSDAKEKVVAEVRRLENEGVR